MALYILKPVGKTGPYKIGWSKQPKERLIQYAGWSPYPLEIVATADVEAKYERRAHARFAHLHSHLEWFHGAPEIHSFVRNVASGEYDFEQLPAPVDLRPGERDELSVALTGLGMRFKKFRDDAPEDLKALHRDRYQHRNAPRRERIKRALAIWRYCEDRDPKPNSVTSRIMKRLEREVA